MTTKSRHSINWGQAFAEVLLIFIGVAVARLADRWADERAERAEERQYLISLRADFEETRASLERSLREIRDNRDLKLALMRLLQGPPAAVPEEALSRMIRESFYMQMPAATMATCACCGMRPSSSGSPNSRTAGATTGRSTQRVSINRTSSRSRFWSPRRA
jgi:hypothetical protein